MHLFSNQKEGSFLVALAASSLGQERVLPKTDSLRRDTRAPRAGSKTLKKLLAWSGLAVRARAFLHSSPGRHRPSDECKILFHSGRLMPHQPQRHDGADVFAHLRDLLSRAVAPEETPHILAGRFGMLYQSLLLHPTSASQRAHSQPGLLPACGSWHGRASSPKDACKKLTTWAAPRLRPAAETSRMNDALRRRGSHLSTLCLCARWRQPERRAAPSHAL